MGRTLLVCRLAVRDLRRRPIEAFLVLLAMTAATATLTLGLGLRAAASDPYDSTRTATNGPDVVASVMPYAGQRPRGPGDLVIDRPAEPSRLAALADAADVVEHSGPHPVIGAELQVSGRTSDVQAMGRDTAPATVDQPAPLQGSWVGDGGVVLEAAFANALDVHVGDAVTLDGRAFDVVGIAVSAATPPYPSVSCLVAPGCVSGAVPDDVRLPAGLLRTPGLVWLTDADVRRLTTDPGALSYVMALQLVDPDGAQAFVDANAPLDAAAPVLVSWEEIRGEATELTRDAQILLGIGAWVLGLLAVGSLSVMVGGRMADQTRRVGLLKAIGGTPGLVAAVLLAEHALVAIGATAVGLTAGSLTAPLLTEPSAGLIGSAGRPPITLSTVGAVTAAALAVAAAATFAPAVRAARTSTVRALADSARPPRRTGWLIAISAPLPAPLLIALRIIARRPRRAVLSIASVAITVSAIFVALVLDAYLAAQSVTQPVTQAVTAGYDDTQVRRQVLLVVMVMVLVLAAINATFIAWTTVLDNRHTSAVARALGATPRDVSGALAAAQVLPALTGAVLGAFPGGFALFVAINAITGGDRSRATLPSLGQLIALVLATVLVVAALTAVPALLGSRRPVAATLRTELA